MENNSIRYNKRNRQFNNRDKKSLIKNNLIIFCSMYLELKAPT